MAVKTAEWKKHQQQETKAVNNEDRLKESTAQLVRLRMRSDYRDVAKAGDFWETDAQKAEELVKLGRAEYAPKSKSVAKREEAMKTASVEEGKE